MNIPEMIELIKSKSHKFPKQKEKHFLLRPCDDSDFVELPTSWLIKCLEEIKNKVPFVTSGMDNFSECEKFTLFLLNQHIDWRPSK